MDEDSVVFTTENNVCRSGTSDISKLLKVLPVLYYTHETCDSVVCCRVDHLIYDVGAVDTIVVKSCRLVIHHECTGTLILKGLIDKLTCKLTLVHAFRYLECISLGSCYVLAGSCSAVLDIVKIDYLRLVLAGCIATCCHICVATAKTHRCRHHCCA